MDSAQTLLVSSRKGLISQPFCLQAEDSVLAFGPLVANHFGARFAQIAWSGAGMVKRPQSGSAFAPTIPELYNRTIPSDPSKKWDFSKFVPEVRAAQSLGTVGGLSGFLTASLNVCHRPEWCCLKRVSISC